MLRSRSGKFWKGRTFYLRLRKPAENHSEVGNFMQYQRSRTWIIPNCDDKWLWTCASDPSDVATCVQGCNEGGNNSLGSKWLWGAPKSPNNVASIFFNSTFASERLSIRTWGCQTCFMPRGRHLTSLRPWVCALCFTLKTTKTSDDNLKHLVNGCYGYMLPWTTKGCYCFQASQRKRYS